jgi:hypothetical protein
MTDESVNPEEYESYKAEIERVNERYAVTNVGADCVVLNRYWDPVRKRKDITFLTFNAFRNRMMNRYVINPWRTPNEKKRKPLGQMWLASPKRKEYRAVVFDPSQTVDPDKYFNLFQGFPVKPDNRGSWRILRDHIFENVCGGSEQIDHYIMSWMARIIQDPGGPRPGTAIVLKGVQGAGKGCVVNSLGRLMGLHYRHILQLSHLVGRFNTHLKDALLVFCDEITWGGDRQAEGILKGLITEPTIPIEQKGRDVLEIDSHINVIIASNNDWIIPAGLEERRFCVLEVQPDHAGDREYFNAMFAELENGGYERMMYDLMHYPLQDIDLRTIPRTPALFDQMISSMGSVHKWWYQRLADGRLLHNDDGWTGEADAYALYNNYLSMCDEVGGINFRPILNQFARKLREICPGMDKSRRRTGGKQAPAYIFPPLEDCRADFERAIQLPVSWNE